MSQFILTCLLKCSRFLGIDSPPCETALHSGNVFDFHCFQFLFNKGLNFGILFGASIVQLPQIIKIIVSKNIVGLSTLGYGMNVLAGLLFVLYNILQNIEFPTWGEALFIAIQNMILLCLCFVYKTKRPQYKSIYLAFIFYTTLTAFILSKFFPSNLKPLLGLAPTPFLIIAKLPQSIQNYKQGHTGQLSVISTVLVFLGNLVRIFTTLTQVDDSIILMTHILAGCLNAVPFIQIIYYWKSTTAILKKSKSFAKNIKKNKYH